MATFGKRLAPRPKTETQIDTVTGNNASLRKWHPRLAARVPSSSFKSTSSVAVVSKVEQSRDPFDLSSSDDETQTHSVTVRGKIQPSDESLWFGSGATDLFDLPSSDDSERKTNKFTSSKRNHKASRQPHYPPSSVSGAVSPRAKRKRASTIDDPLKLPKYTEHENTPDNAPTACNLVEGLQSRMSPVGLSGIEFASVSSLSPIDQKSTKSDRLADSAPSLIRQFTKSISAPEPLQAMVRAVQHDTLTSTPICATPQNRSYSATLTQSPGRTSLALPATSYRASSLWDKLLTPASKSQTLAELLTRNLTQKSPHSVSSWSSAQRVQLVTSKKLQHSSTHISKCFQNSTDNDDGSPCDESCTCEGLSSFSEDEDIPQLIYPSRNAYAVTHSSFAGTPQATYGQQRFLAKEKQQIDMLDFLIDDVNPVVDLETHSVAVTSEDEDEDSTKPLTVQELKAAGSKRRLVSELEHVLDGIDADSLVNISVQRSELLELVAKLEDPQQIVLLVDHGLDKRLIKAIANFNDPICKVISVICLLRLINGSSNLGLVRYIKDSGCLSNIAQSFALTDDICSLARRRNMNMSKAAQASVAQFRNVTLSWPPIGEKIRCLSPKHTSILFLEWLVRWARELGCRDTILEEILIASLVSVLDSQQSADKSLDSCSLLILSTLELTSSYVAGRGRSVWPSVTLKKLERVITLALRQDNSSSVLDHSAGVKHSILKLLLNVTNNNSRVCSIFSDSALVRNLLCQISSGIRLLYDTSSKSEDVLMDEVILSLGALINLAELSDKARLCSLQDNGRTLEQLVSFFCQKQHTVTESRSVEESTANIPFGYLALLMVNLCQNAVVRTFILGQLPSYKLIAAAEEFIRVHQRTDREIDGDEGAELYQSYTNRLVAMVDRLRILKLSSDDSQMHIEESRF